jgi:hypothetical protein
MQHTITKTTLHVTVDPKTDGYDFQNTLSRVFWRECVAAMEKILDKYGKTEEVVMIDTLALDLGRINAQSWESDFKSTLLQALETVLANKSLYQKTSVEYNDGQGTDKPNATLMSLRLHLFDIWLHFLKTGTLPPSVSTPIEADMLKAVAETLSLDARAEQLLRALLSENATVFDISAPKPSPSLQRLTLQFDEVFLMRLAALFTRTNLEKLAQLRVSFLKYIEQHVGGLKKDKTHQALLLLYSKTAFWQVVLTHIIQTNVKKTNVETLALMPFISFLAENPQAYATWFLTNDTPMNAGSVLPSNFSVSAWKATHKEILKRIKAKKGSTHFDKYNHPERQAIETGDLKKAKTKINIAKDDKNTNEASNSVKKPIKEKDKPTEGTHYIKHAGVVLVHTFLPHLFKELKLINDTKQFIHEAAQHKAIHLIHYIASGLEGLPEYNLLLPKVLGGLPLDTPIERKIVLTKKEKKEAQEMLKAAINYWTSIDGLREGFFDRDAKLSHDEKGWLLQVETKTQDILLSQLPWSIGMIKLPWMKAMLRVEWI